MTPKLALVTVGVAAALLGAPSAFGQTPEAFDREANRASLTATAPDVVERAVLGKHLALLATLDARERARTTASAASIASSDAFTRALDSRTAGIPIASSDALTRAVENRVTPSRDPVVDDRFHIDTTGIAAPIVASQSGIEWHDVGLGVGIGIALMLGLGLALRLNGSRALAH